MWFTFTCSFDTWIRDFYSTFTFTKVIFDLITLSPRWCFVHSSSLWILPQFFLSKSASCGFRRVGTRAEKPKLELQNFFFGSSRSCFSLFFSRSAWLQFSVRLFICAPPPLWFYLLSYMFNIRSACICFCLLSLPLSQHAILLPISFRSVRL